MNVRFAAFVLIFSLAALGCQAPEDIAGGAGDEEGGASIGPQFRYDSTWPKLPLPNKWTFHGVTGLWVDRDDVIWVMHRPDDLNETENYASLNPPTADCCVRAPSILAFDTEGNLVHAGTPPAGT